MSYALLKAIHILGMSLFLGAGLGTAFLKLNVDRTRDPKLIAWALGHVVLADWLFTVPSGIIMPVTGLWMVSQLGIPWTGGWVAWGLGLYALAGVCWLPAAFMQIRMHRLAKEAAAAGADLPPAYDRLTRLWIALGVPAFAAAMLTVYIMVTKHLPW